MNKIKEALDDLNKLFSNKSPVFNVAHHLQARFLSKHKETITQALESALEKDGYVLVPVDENRKLKIALAHHINADAYASTFPDDEADHEALKKQETWNRLTARTFISEEMEEICMQEYKSHYSHKWDGEGERCSKCGEKDWYAEPVCTPKAAQEG